MAWNGSNGKNTSGTSTAKRPVGGARKSPSIMRGAFAALAVVALATGAWWWLSRGDGGAGGEPEKPEPKPQQRQRVETPAATTNAVPTPPTQEEKRLAEIKYFEDKYGTNMPPGVKTHVYFLKNPPKTHYKIKGRFDYFRHPSERQIASLVSVEPGTFILSPPEFGESFNRDFLASILDKTEILPDDDEETKAMKELVYETKRQMLEIQRSEGKLPSEILTQHAEVLYELGQVEKTLEEELAKVRNNPDVSDEDVEDLFRAANKIRESKGLPAQTVPDFSKRSIRLRRRLARQNLSK